MQRQNGRTYVSRLPASQAQGHSSEEDDIARTTLEDTFRRHFNARFAPLHESNAETPENLPALSEPTAEQGDWEGFSSSGEDVEVIEVIKNSASRTSPKPVASSAKPQAQSNRSISVSDDRDSLENDRALQKLITEARLFDVSASSRTLGGRRRLLASQLQDLGAKSSIWKPDRMPLSHRRGIADKILRKENSRQHEARENGITLGRLTEVKSRQTPRVRSIDAPAIGKYQKGTLRLRKRDLSFIKRS